MDDLPTLVARWMPWVFRVVPSSISRLNPDPIIVLGNQKAGTSAITHLLAEYGGLSKTVDIPESWWPTLESLLAGEKTVRELASETPHRFASSVIKEPNLTFFLPELLELYPEARFTFVVRDPRSNIRSMLNRMGLPGDRESIRHEDIPDTWKHLFNADAWELSEGQYVDQLAERWSRAARIYEAHAQRIHLVKFEDFLADKTGTIAHLANALGVNQRYPIGDLVDIQYQPRGNRDVSWVDFFGVPALQRIERICEHGMTFFDYPLTDEGSVHD